MFFRFLTSIFVVYCFGFSLAQANELRFGIWEHDAELFGIGGQKGKETSFSLSAEYLAEPLEALSFIGSPRPFIGGLVNLEGETSFANAGVTWRASVTEKFFVDYAFGMSVHDGTLEVPSPNSETDLAVITDLVNRKATEIEFGSRFLFRNAFSIGYGLTDDTSIELVWEHMSNGQIFDQVNEGIDNVGLRYGRKF